MLQSLVREGSLTGAGVESVLSLVAGCVVLSLDRAVGVPKGRRECAKEGGQERPDRQVGLPGNDFVDGGAGDVSVRELDGCAPALGKGSPSLSLSANDPTTHFPAYVTLCDGQKACGCPRVGRSRACWRATEARCASC
jgi:hypothetical protein